MKNLHESHYKEISPVKTVEKIKSILDELEIGVEENWCDKSDIETYSLRLSIKGTNIGSNGKGISKEYARASAYAEFMERLQNDILVSAYIRQDVRTTREERNLGQEPDGKIMTSEEIIDQGGSFIDFYFKNRQMEKATRNEKIEKFKAINKFEYMLTGDDNSFFCLPFYSCREKKVYYLPKHIYGKYYGSNGMAAGNGRAEALVQGYSEILERISQMRIFNEKPILPIIPDEYIKNTPYVYDMYKKLQSIDGYKAELLDCSFGGQYPVAGLLIRQINTGCYGIKLGCHPDFSLAMERTFTEAAQGNDVTAYVNRSVLDFHNNNVNSKINIENSFKTGLAQYPYEIFMAKDQEHFHECTSVDGKSNEELFKEITNHFIAEGHDVLIRDVSNLGFYSYHIIIPGISELKPGADSDFRAANTRAFVTSLLMQPKIINKDNSRYITASFGYYAQSSMNNTLSSFYPEIKNVELPGEKYFCGMSYMTAMCEAMCGNFNRAEKCIEYVEKSAINTNQSDEEIKKMRVIRYYFSARSIGYSHVETIEYLSEWFDKSFCELVDFLFENMDEVIIKQYPDLSNWRELPEFEPQRICFKIINNLRKKQIENPINQKQIECLL